MNNKKYENILLNFIGVFFLIFSISSIINTIYIGNIEGILWLCYAGLFIISIGVLSKNGELILSQLNILTIPLIFWVIDFLSFFILGKTIFGITDYMFAPRPVIGTIISLQHLFTLPLSLFSLYLIKIKKKRHPWKISMFQLTLIFIIIFFLTTRENNINCVFRSCIEGLNISRFYSLTWFVISFLGVFITNLVIIKLLKLVK